MGETDRVRNEYITKSQRGEKYLTNNCLLKHVIDGKIEGRIDMTGRRGRKRKNLLYDLRKKGDTQS
jgi:hypothetical protein